MTAFRLPVVSGAPAAPSLTPVPTEAAVPSWYVLGPAIGRGASGRVYAAVTSAGTRVAVKRLARAGGAGLPAMPAHPHLLPVLARRSADDATEVVTPLAPGGSLRRLLDTGFPLPLHWSLGVVAQVAEALEHLHAAGWIHGDVKPSNILLTATGDVLLGDLDGAMPAAAPQGAGGTVAYLAPERLRGAPATHAADGYALAATACHLLCGTRLFPAGHAARLAAAASPGPTPRLPAALAAVLRRGLAPRPSDRYSAPAAFAAALTAAGAGACPSQPRLRRRMVGAVTLAGVAAGAALGAPTLPLALASLLLAYLVALESTRHAVPAGAGRLLVRTPEELLAPERPAPNRAAMMAVLRYAAHVAIASLALAVLPWATLPDAGAGVLRATLGGAGCLAAAGLTARGGVAGLGLAALLAGPGLGVWLGWGAWAVAGQGVAALLLGRRRWLPWLRAVRAVVGSRP